jgi:hypothetical protein
MLLLDNQLVRRTLTGKSLIISGLAVGVRTLFVLNTANVGWLYVVN